MCVNMFVKFLRGVCLELEVSQAVGEEKVGKVERESVSFFSLSNYYPFKKQFYCGAIIAASDNKGSIEKFRCPLLN